MRGRTRRLEFMLIALPLAIMLLAIAQTVSAYTPLPPHHQNDFITWQQDTEGNVFYHPATGNLDPIFDAEIQYAQPWLGRYGQYAIQGTSEFVWRWEWDIPGSRGYMPWAADYSQTAFSRKDRERRLSALIASARHDPNPHIYSSGGVHGPSNQAGLWGPFGGETFSSEMDYFGIVSYAPYWNLGVGYSTDEGLGAGGYGWDAFNRWGWMGTRMLEGGTSDMTQQYNAVERSGVAKNALGCGRYALGRWFIASRPGDNPPILPVVAGSDTDWNYLEQGLGGLAISPDCGDERSPFPPSCIATHAQSYGHAASHRNTSTYCPEDHRRAVWDDVSQSFIIPISDDDGSGDPQWSWVGSLGRTVSVEIIMRKIVPGLYRSSGGVFEPVFPTQYAPDTDPTVTYPQYEYSWPLPAELQEDYSKWMTPLHATEFTQVVGGEKTGTEFGYGDTDAEWWSSFNANPTGQTASVWGGHWTYAGMIPMDVRAIRGRDLDTGDDGFTVYDPTTNTWVNPESIELQAGETYTFRVQLFTGGADSSPFDDRPRGSVEVWSATSLEKSRSSFNLIFSESSITDVKRNSFQEYTFDYEIPSTSYIDPVSNEHSIAFRVIFRARRRQASGGSASEWPTQSGFYPYIGAVSGYEGLPTVAPIAEPLVLGRIPATGEIEDYIVPLSPPPLRYEGHIYEIPRTTSPGEVPVTPLSNVSVTLRLREYLPAGAGIVNSIITSTVTNSEGYYEFDLGQYEKMYWEDRVYVDIIAPNAAQNLSLYTVAPGESRTLHRTMYNLEINLVNPTSPAGYDYTHYEDFNDPLKQNVYGSFEYNDFGYAAIIVDGGYYEVFSGSPIRSSEPVTLTGETCVATGLDLDCTEIHTDYAVTDVNGEFVFNLGDWDAGWTNYMRRIRLEYPGYVYPDGVALRYFYHELGDPRGVETIDPSPGTEYVLREGGWQDWLNNDVFYGAVSVDIIRRWPVVPPNPDELEPAVATTNLGEVRRQAVTTTLRYYDASVGSWEDYPDDSEVLLEVVITPDSNDREYYFHDSLCNDGDPSCTLLIGGSLDEPESPWTQVVEDCPASILYPSSHICIYENTAMNTDVSSAPPNGRVLDTDAWPKDWAYNVFSRTPNSTYVARALWTVYWDGSEIEELWTDYVSWSVLSHAAPIEED